MDVERRVRALVGGIMGRKCPICKPTYPFSYILAKFNVVT